MAIQITKIKPEFVDERGYISRLIDQDEFKIRSVLYIKRKKGTDGANHYHKQDAHYIYCLSGRLKYLEKDMSKDDSEIESAIMEEGDLVLSRPMMWHCTEFLEDTVLLAFSTENRDQEKYEKDTVRIKFSH